MQAVRRSWRVGRQAATATSADLNGRGDSAASAGGNMSTLHAPYGAQATAATLWGSQGGLESAGGAAPTFGWLGAAAAPPLSATKQGRSCQVGAARSGEGQERFHAARAHIGLEERGWPCAGMGVPYAFRASSPSSHSDQDHPQRSGAPAVPRGVGRTRALGSGLAPARSWMAQGDHPQVKRRAAAGPCALQRQAPCGRELWRAIALQTATNWMHQSQLDAPETTAEQKCHGEAAGAARRTQRRAAVPAAGPVHVSCAACCTFKHRIQV